MSERLREFPYHPDPVATGFVAACDVTCVCCGRARGFIYTGPVFAEQDLDKRLCPWCIADGSAAERLRATFTDDADVPDGVPAEVVAAVGARTPGFIAWQQEHWLYHCDDGAAFLGVVGREQLAQHPDALQALREQCTADGLTVGQAQEFLDSLDAEGSPTAYLFCCRHCAIQLAFADSD